MDWQTIKDYRWWLLSAMMIVLFLIGLFFYINRPIKKVVIIGDFNQLTPSCINTVLQSSIRGRYWPTHQHHLFQQAQSHCPWLYAWQWHYAWPHTMVIKLQENLPQLVFNQQSLLNQANQLFTPKQLPQNLPNVSFVGPPGQFENMLAFYKQALSLFSAQNFSIKKLALDENSTYQLTLNNDIILKFNQQDALATLARFLSVDQQLFGHRHQPIQAIDLRYPHGFAVQWKNH